MAKITKEDVIEFISNMTVLELSEFVKELEDKFGVSAAAPMARQAPISGGRSGARPSRNLNDPLMFRPGEIPSRSFPGTPWPNKKNSG